MLKRYEVTVTYHVYANDESEATGQAFENRVVPETVDVYDLPERKKIEIDYIPF
jgi:hypothetical protein